jgi:hypothetical protein
MIVTALKIQKGENMEVAHPDICVEVSEDCNAERVTFKQV